MRIGTVTESINIILNSVNINSAFLSSLGQKRWFMDSLSARSDFFSSHEKIEGTSEVTIVRGRHGVERSSVLRISIEEIEIGVVFFSHNGAQLTFNLGRNIFVFTLFNTSFSQQSTSFFESESRNGCLEFERFESELFVNDGEFFSESFIQICKNVDEHISHDIHQFMI